MGRNTCKRAVGNPDSSLHEDNSIEAILGM